jgi:formate dehydrogenase subunit delta
MELNHLVKMANQIGSFFEAYPDPEQARSEVASHIRRFWDPRMRSALLDHLEEAKTAGLSPFVADAVGRLRS